jgi:hypothetical protein
LYCNAIQKHFYSKLIKIFFSHIFFLQPQQRKAIQDRFKGGERNCPTCGEELPFFELIPNVNLRRSIDGWKQREMDLKFQAAVSGISKNALREHEISGGNSPLCCQICRGWTHSKISGILSTRD